MILWTIQHRDAYEKMKETGILRSNESYIIDDSFEKAYMWMSEQMQKRIGIAPDGVRFPVWAWYQWEGKRKRPDMRFHGRGWGEKGTPIVLLTLDVPDEQVLLSDFDYWHFVLNDVPLMLLDEEETEYSDKEKQKSWENIFDVNCTFDGESHDTLSTQATLWEIRRGWVIQAEYFVSR